MKTLGEHVKAFMTDNAWSAAKMAAEVTKKNGGKKVSRQSIENLWVKNIETPQYIAALAATMGSTVEAMKAPGTTFTAAGHAQAIGGASLALGDSISSGRGSLASAMTTIARHMREADSMTREVVAPFLARLATAPDDVGRITRLIESMIDVEREHTPAPVVAESLVDTGAPMTGVEQDAQIKEFKAMRRATRAAGKVTIKIKRERQTGGAA